MNMSKIGHATSDSVLRANRKLYDCIADRYEQIDGRRSQELLLWLRENLIRIRRQTAGESFLDLGTGSGLVTRCATGLFTFRIGLDLSATIMALNRDSFDAAVVADTNCLPFSNKSFDVVTCFAVLHHLFSFEALVAELARILKPGGVFYCDHDMDVSFSKRFRFPLSLYRKMRNSYARYSEACSTITADIYHLAEWHEDGVDSGHLVTLLQRSGFSVDARFHWFGLTSVTNRLFHKKTFKAGFAPLLSVTAVRL
jgi:ubiquinone/menaquinone biosynthesis C-methylase UbiE